MDFLLILIGLMFLFMGAYFFGGFCVRHLGQILGIKGTGELSEGEIFDHLFNHK